MDTTAHPRDLFIALTEAALEVSSPSRAFRADLTITLTPAMPSMQSTTLSFKLDSVKPEELSSILQSLRASSAPTSLRTPE